MRQSGSRGSPSIHWQVPRGGKPPMGPMTSGASMRLDTGLGVEASSGALGIDRAIVRDFFIGASDWPPSSPSRSSLPITALRVTPPRARAIWLADRPSVQRFLSCSTRWSDQAACCSHQPISPSLAWNARNGDPSVRRCRDTSRELFCELRPSPRLSRAALPWTRLSGHGWRPESDRSRSPSPRGQHPSQAARNPMMAAASAAGRTVLP